jgi:hypothetical protein
LVAALAASTRFEKKLRVALDWTLDVFFSKDFVQFLHKRSPVVVSEASRFAPPQVHQIAGAAPATGEQGEPDHLIRDNPQPRPSAKI